MNPSTKFVNNLPHTPVGKTATLDVVNSQLGSQLVVITRQAGDGVQMVMQDVLYADFTLLAAEDELADGLRMTFTKDNVPLATRHARAPQQNVSELFVDLTTLHKNNIQSVKVEAFAGLQPVSYDTKQPRNQPYYSVPTNGSSIETQKDPGNNDTEFMVARADVPPDTVYYYENEDGSWGYGYDWTSNAQVTLFKPDGSSEQVETDLLRMTVPAQGSSGPVTFEITRDENTQPGTNPDGLATFILAYNKLMPKTGITRSTVASGDRASTKRMKAPGEAA